jgi:hypothetical protein
MAARRVIPNARPAQAARVAAQQVGGDAGFINDDVLSRVVERQRLAPPPPGDRDIRATLFVGVYGLV